jgi:hypothetical protein
VLPEGSIKELSISARGKPDDVATAVQKHLATGLTASEFATIAGLAVRLPFLSVALRPSNKIRLRPRLLAEST